MQLGKENTRGPRGRLAALSAVVALTVGLSIVAFGAPAGADKGSGVSSAAITNTTISSAGPLTNISLSNELNCQVDHTGDSSHEFYGDVPGACATLVAVNDTLYGSADIPAGPTPAEYTPVSQSAVTGSGTSADPFKVVTVVDAGTDLRLTETDSYVAGSEAYRTDVQVENISAGPQTFVLYRAGDCYLQNSDKGLGDLLNDGSVGCHGTDDQGVTRNDRVERWIPITAGSAAYEAYYGDVWDAVVTQNPFPGSCQCDTWQDNGAGLSWSGSLAAGASATYSHLTVFSPTGAVAPFLSKTADSDSATPGLSDSYTVTVNNPNGGDVTLSSLTDHLPAGFSYVAGSTTGLTTADPVVSGQDITWSGAFPVSAGGTATLHFTVTVSTVPGTYLNSVDGVSASTAIVGSGATAPVVVEAATVAPRFTG
jgi:uncharacterized repeat protein (TIGR01451 family)